MKESVPYLRKANATDMQLLYKWRNDPEVRRNSFQTGEISLDTHREWFMNALSRPDILIYILMLGDKAAGQVRLNLENSTGRISYSIAAEYRGKGYGKQILQLAESELAANPDIDSLLGEVRKENIPSQKVFRSLGYAETEEADHFRYSKKLR